MSDYKKQTTTFREVVETRKMSQEEFGYVFWKIESPSDFRHQVLYSVFYCLNLIEEWDKFWKKINTSNPYVYE